MISRNAAGELASVAFLPGQPSGASGMESDVPLLL